MTRIWEYQHFLAADVPARRAEGWRLCGPSLCIGGWDSVLMRRRVK